MHQTSANLSEHNFKDAHSFVPERWLGDQRYAEDDRAAMQPFSFGLRNCIGKVSETRNSQQIMLTAYVELGLRGDKWYPSANGMAFRYVTL